MQSPYHPATPTVLDAFNWSEVFGPWTTRHTRPSDANFRPVVESALGRARARSI